MAAERRLRGQSWQSPGGSGHVQSARHRHAVESRERPDFVLRVQLSQHNPLTPVCTLGRRQHRHPRSLHRLQRQFGALQGGGDFQLRRAQNSAPKTAVRADLQITASYTWSHSLDDQSGEGLFYTGNNSEDLKSGYGSSDFDRTHVFLVNCDLRSSRQAQPSKRINWSMAS